jgi:hypothetical protein
MWGKNNVGQHNFVCDANPKLKITSEEKFVTSKLWGINNVGLHSFVHG